MTRPTVAAFTDDWWGDLPETYRTSDEAGGFVLLRWMDTIGARVQILLDLASRIDDADGAKTSELVDPQLGDAAWLRWQAFARGVQLAPGLTVEQQRDAITHGIGGQNAGRADAIAAAVRGTLTGSRYVRVIPRWGGDRWTVMVRTRTSETPSPDAVLAAIEAQDVAPAGVKIVTSNYEPTWATVEAAYPTWADRNGKTWLEIDETGAPTS